MLNLKKNLIICTEPILCSMIYVPVRAEALKTLGLYQATIKQLLDDVSRPVLFIKES